MILILLVAYSLGAEYEKGTLYFGIGETMQEKLEDKKIDEYNVLVPGTTTEDSKFYPIVKDEAEFNSLKVRLVSLSDVSTCPAIGYSYIYGLYGLLGFSIKADENANISPSITFLIKNVLITQKCEGLEYGFESYSLYNFGITDADCAPNTAIPDNTSLCLDGSQPKVYLKGSRVGSFFKSDAETVKKLIARFGAVQIGLDVIIGWDGPNWIDANWGAFQYFWDKFEIDYSKMDYEGRVIAVGDKPVDCSKVTETTSVDLCACPSDKKDLKKDPRYVKGGKCSAMSVKTQMNFIVLFAVLPMLALIY